MSIITVDWSVNNGAETKIVKHPSGDFWHEGNVCSKLLTENERHPTSMDVILDEISWFEKYSNECISVYDKWVGKNLPVKSYISHLRSCAKEIESYS